MLMVHVLFCLVFLACRLTNKCCPGYVSILLPFHAIDLLHAKFPAASRRKFGLCAKQVWEAQKFTFQQQESSQTTPPGSGSRLVRVFAALFGLFLAKLVGGCIFFWCACYQCCTVLQMLLAAATDFFTKYTLFAGVNHDATPRSLRTRGLIRLGNLSRYPRDRHCACILGCDVALRAICC